MMSDNEDTASTGEVTAEVKAEVEEVTTAGRNWQFHDHLNMLEAVEESGADLLPKKSPTWTALSNETLGPNARSGQAFQRQLTALKSKGGELISTHSTISNALKWADCKTDEAR